MVYRRVRTSRHDAITRRQGSADFMMTDKAASDSRIVLGDPVPWFNTPLVTGGALHVSAGRWVMLSFLGSPGNPQAGEELAKLLENADLFREDHLIACFVLTGPPPDAARLAAISGNALFFLADYDGAIAARSAPRISRAPSCSTPCCARLRISAGIFRKDMRKPSPTFCAAFQAWMIPPAFRCSLPP